MTQADAVRTYAMNGLTSGHGPGTSGWRQAHPVSDRGAGLR
jgi:hypothetical protein